MPARHVRLLLILLDASLLFVAHGIDLSPPSTGVGAAAGNKRTQGVRSKVRNAYTFPIFERTFFMDALL